MADPEQVTLNTTESTASPTQVTTHINNSTDTYGKNNYEERNCGERGDDDGDDNISSPDNLGLGWASRHVKASISCIYETAEESPPRLPAREINIKGAALQN